MTLSASANRGEAGATVEEESNMLAPIFPEPPSSIEATPLSACDAIAERLHAAKDRWAALPIPKRIAALRVLAKRSKLLEAFDEVRFLAPPL